MFIKRTERVSFCFRCLSGEETAKSLNSAIRRDIYWHIIGGKNRLLVKEDGQKYIVKDLIGARGVYLILGVQEGAFNW